MLCSAWYHLSSNDYVRFPAKRGLRQHLRIPSEPRMAQGNSHASLVSPGRGSEIAKQTRIQGSLGQGSCNLRGLSKQRDRETLFVSWEIVKIILIRFICGHISQLLGKRLRPTYRDMQRREIKRADYIL